MNSVYHFIVVLLSIFVLSLYSLNKEYNGEKVDIDLPDLTAKTNRFGIVGKEFFIGKKTLVYFGYTACGGICYQRVSLFNRIKEEYKSDLYFTFISIDPESDTLDRLYRYFDNAGIEFNSLVVNQEFMGLLENRTKNIFNPGDRPKNHSDIIYYVDDAVVKIIFFPNTIREDLIIEDIKKISG